MSHDEGEKQVVCSDKYLDDCKVGLATTVVTYEHAESTQKRYTQTISSIGYVGFMALWSQLWGKVGDVYLLISGALILVSGSIFIGIEIIDVRVNGTKLFNKKVLISNLEQAIWDKDKEKIISLFEQLNYRKENKQEIHSRFCNISIFTGLSAGAFLVLGIIVKLMGSSLPIAWSATVMSDFLQNPIVQYFGNFLFSGLGLLLVWELWLKNHFAKKLKDHEAKLANELEDTKYKINSLFNKVSMVQKKEFEVLPKAWDKLCEASQDLQEYVGGDYTERDYADFDDKSIEDMLASEGWDEYYIKLMVNQKINPNAYLNILKFVRYTTAFKSLYDFYHYVNKSKIFLTASIKSEFVKAIGISKMIIDTNLQKNFNSNTPEDTESLKELNEKMKSIIVKIENLLQEKLQFDKAL